MVKSVKKDITMKYNINNELKNIAKFRGAMVCNLYPLLNMFYKTNKCKSDDKVSVKKYSTPGYENATISTLVIEPKKCGDKLPCIMFFHGGGSLLKASNAHYKIAKLYAEKANCKVVLPDYRLLPKHRYPVAIEDCYKTYLWVAQSAEMLNINTDKMIVAGDSAGGNIAAAVTLMLRDRKHCIPKGVLLIYPILDKNMSSESMKKYTDTPIWDSKCTELFWKMYLENQETEQVKYASIMDTDSLAFFPKTYVEVAEFDCLHDEGVAFAERLQSENIPVELHETKGGCHGYEAALNSKIVKDSVDRRIKWLRSIFD